ncbi:YihY family inner membrane protein [Thalassospira tepidiphila]|jgi:membrane protein|uniref:YihY family inner membrane protein n=1 Tax=Thalassospira tepidiphila TaxID=393657 RepID=UPI001BD0068B|nr:YihY family inner membrane protein [Thalassospira tepidiphila]MBS8272217.1 YihY family inner membrane protein [Thalassospira tepidiphila]
MVEIQKLLADRTAFWRYAVMRFVHDKSVQRAAGLSYTTLLAMVPFLAIALTVLSAFPVFDEFKDQIMNVVLNNFLPETDEQVTGYLGGFLQNTGQMTAIGTIVLGLTAVMFLSAIEGAMNDVFRVTSPRKLLSRLVVFWTLLTVGPMLLGLSLSLGSYIFAMRHLVGGEVLGRQIGQLTFLAPFILSAMAFSLLFIGMPNRSVSVVDGGVGGLVAAVLFETLKKGFGFYVTTFPTYQTIYGAVAIVPIFLLWMYLTWIVILLGAQVAAGRSEWRAARAAGLIPDPRVAVPGHMERIIAVLRVLEYLQNCFHEAAKPPTYRRMMRDVKLGGRDLNWALAALRRQKLIERSDKHRWLLSGDLSRISLMDLMTRLGLFLDYDRLLVVQTDGGWPVAMRERLIELEKKRETVLDVKVGELLDTPRPEDKVPEQIKKDPDQDKGGDIDEKEISNAMN